MSYVVASDFFSPPVPLVAFAGFPDLHTVVRENIPNPRSFSFISIDFGTTFPSAKEKRENLYANDGKSDLYEGYKPRGFVKQGWVEKHRTKIPALTCLFFERDESVEWSLQEMQMVSTFAAFRQSHASREMKIMIVVVCHRNVLSEEVEMEEKLNGIRKTLNVTSKHVTLLKTVDLKSSLKKFEVTMMELSGDYYRTCCRRWKRLQPRFSKVQIVMSIRHLFKLAYFSEIIRDDESSIKYYKETFEMLKLCPDSIQVRVIAHIVTFKLIRIYLSIYRYDNNLYCSAVKLDEAIEQFELFRSFFNTTIRASDPSDEISVVGLRARLLSKSYATMGEMMELMTGKVPDSKLVSNRLYYCAYYYATAEKYLSEWESGRGESIVNELKIDAAERFLGDSLKTFITKSDSCTDYLLMAHASYRRLGAPTRRITDHIGGQLARRYAGVKDDLALTFFESIIKTYREEKWWTILTSHLRCARECAARVNSSLEVGFLLELMCPKLHTKDEEKKLFQTRLFELLQGSNCKFTPITNELSPLLAPFSACAGLSLKHSPDLNSYNVLFKASLRSHFLLPVSIFKIELKVCSEIFSVQEINFAVDSLQSWEFEFNVVLSESDPPRKLQCDQISIYFTPDFYVNVPYEDLFDFSRVLTLTPCIPVVSLALLSRAPACVHAQNPIVLCISANPPVVGKSVLVCAAGSEEYSLEGILFHYNDSWKPITDPILLEPFTELKVPLMIHCTDHAIKTVTISFTLTYESGETFMSFDIPVVSPFKSSCRYFTPVCTESKTLDSNSDVLMICDVENITPHTFVLEEMEIDYNNNFLEKGEKSSILPLEMLPNSRISFTRILSPNSDYYHDAKGIQLKWTYKKVLTASVDIPLTELATTLQPCTYIEKVLTLPLEKSVFIISCDFIPITSLGNVLPLYVKIKNTSRLLKDLILTVSESPYFLVGGPKNSDLKLFPMEEITLSFRLVPLQSGHVSLPPIQIEQKTDKEEKSCIIFNSLNSGMIFVTPKSRQIESSIQG